VGRVLAAGALECDQAVGFLERAVAIFVAQALFAGAFSAFAL
jgi:hypothetical protein